MKTNAQRMASLLVACLCFAACADEWRPVSAPLSAESSAPLRTMVVNGPDDIPLEPGEELPEAFRTATQVLTFIDAGFMPGIVWATASIDHYSNNARIVLTLKLKKGEQVVDSDSAVALSEALLPENRHTVARVNLSVPGDCGYRADAKADGSVWMSFPVPRTGSLFTWGRLTSTVFKLASQPACPPITVAPASDWISDAYGLLDFAETEMEDGIDNYYFGDCEICQKWYAYIDDELIATWWECASVYDFYCDDIRV